MSAYRKSLQRLTESELLDRGLALGVDWDAYVVDFTGYLAPKGVDRRRLLLDYPDSHTRAGQVVREYLRRFSRRECNLLKSGT